MALVCALLPGAMATSATELQADASMVSCEVGYGGDVLRVTTTPDTGAYQAPETDIAGRFRFKLVALGEAGHIRTVKVYVYANAHGNATILHAASYEPHASGNFSGTQTLYAPPLGRELQYRCALVERATS